MDIVEVMQRSLQNQYIAYKNDNSRLQVIG